MQTTTQPEIKSGAKGKAVKRAQRALRRTPDPSVAVDGIFGPATEKAVKGFQAANPPLAVDGIVGAATWAALPNGGAMPVLKEGSDIDAVKALQEALAHGAAGQWGAGPGQIDGEFGPNTRASVEALQKWAHIKVDGVVGDRTWNVPVGEHSTDLEVVVGLQYIAEP